MAVKTRNSTKASTAGWLLLGGVIGPLLFIVVFLIEGAIRWGYDPLRHPVSSLSIGAFGWVQSLNFIVSGALLVAFALGARLAMQAWQPSRWGFGLLLAIGIGLIGAGFFTCVPLNGYPPGTPLVPLTKTITERLHDLFSLPVFLGLPVACFVFARRFARLGQRGRMFFSILCGAGVFVFFVLAAMGFNQVAGLDGIAGLFQRISIITGWAWLVWMALDLRRLLAG